MRILFLLLALPILLLICAVTMLWIPLPQPLSGERDLVAAIGTGILGAGYLVGLAGYVIASLRRARRRLDATLTSAGLVAERHMVFGRRYRGLIQGRGVQIRFMPSQARRPARLDVYVDADLGTRMAIGRQRPLLDCRDCPRLDLDDASLSKLRVYAQDEACARSLLVDSTIRAVLSRLLDDQPGSDQAVPGFRELYLQPDRVWWRARPWQIAEGQLEGWLDHLLALAAAGEQALASS